MPTWIFSRNTWIVIVVTGLLVGGAWWWQNQKSSWYHAGYNARKAEESDAKSKQESADIIELQRLLGVKEQEREAAVALATELQKREPEKVVEYVTEYLESPNRCERLGDGFAELHNAIHGINQ